MNYFKINFALFLICLTKTKLDAKSPIIEDKIQITRPNEIKQVVENLYLEEFNRETILKFLTERKWTENLFNAEFREWAMFGICKNIVNKEIQNPQNDHQKYKLEMPAIFHKFHNELKEKFDKICKNAENGEILENSMAEIGKILDELFSPKNDIVQQMQAVNVQYKEEKLGNHENLNVEDTFEKIVNKLVEEKKFHSKILTQSRHIMNEVFNSLPSDDSLYKNIKSLLEKPISMPSQIMELATTLWSNFSKKRQLEEKHFDKLEDEANLKTISPKESQIRQKRALPIDRTLFDGIIILLAICITLNEFEFNLIGHNIVPLLITHILQLPDPIEQVYVQAVEGGIRLLYDHIHYFMAAFCAYFFWSLEPVFRQRLTRERWNRVGHYMSGVQAFKSANTGIRDGARNLQRIVSRTVSTGSRGASSAAQQVQAVHQRKIEENSGNNVGSSHGVGRNDSAGIPIRNNGRLQAVPGVGHVHSVYEVGESSADAERRSQERERNELHGIHVGNDGQLQAVPGVEPNAMDENIQNSENRNPHGSLENSPESVDNSNALVAMEPYLVEGRSHTRTHSQSQSLGELLHLADRQEEGGMEIVPVVPYGEQQPPAGPPPSTENMQIQVYNKKPKKLWQRVKANLSKCIRPPCGVRKDDVLRSP